MRSGMSILRSLSVMAVLCPSNPRSFAFASTVPPPLVRVSGRWMLEKMLVGPELREFPLHAKLPDANISMKITEASDGTFTLRSKVINSLKFTARVMNGSVSEPFQKLSVTPGMMTRMGGSPEEMETEMTFVHGLAHAEQWYEQDDHLIVKGATGELSFVRPADVLATTMRMEHQQSENVTETQSMYTGRWTLKQMSVGPELMMFPLQARLPDTEISVMIEEDGADAFRLRVKAINAMTFSARVLAGDLQPFQKMVFAPGRSTRMTGSSEEMSVESTFVDGLESADRWYARNDQLLIVGPTIELSFVRAGGANESAETGGRKLRALPAIADVDERASLRAQLQSKMEELRAARKVLTDQGVERAQITILTAPLVTRIKSLKEQLGRAQFQDVVPKPLFSRPVLNTEHGFGQPSLHV